MQGLATQANFLDLNAVAKVEGIETKIDVDLESSTSGDNGFLSSLLNAIDETNKFLPDRLKISDKEIMQEAIAQLQSGSPLLSAGLEQDEKMSIFESLSFMEVLGILEKLQIKSFDVKLANLSNQSQELIKTQSNLNALKDAKSLDELFKIANDLNLNVSKIKVDRLLDLKNTFPNLDKANFFTSSVESVFKDFLNNKISNILDKVEKKDNTQSSILSSLLNNKNITKDSKNKDALTQLLKTVNHTEKTANKVDKKESKDTANKENDDVLNIKTQSKDVKIEALNEEATKIKEEVSKVTPTQKDEKIISKELVRDDKNIKSADFETKKQNLNPLEPDTTQSKDTKTNEIKTDTKELNFTHSKEQTQTQTTTNTQNTTNSITNKEMPKKDFVAQNEIKTDNTKESENLSKNQSQESKPTSKLESNEALKQTTEPQSKQNQDNKINLENTQNKTVEKNPTKSAENLTISTPLRDENLPNESKNTENLAQKTVQNKTVNLNTVLQNLQNTNENNSQKQEQSKNSETQPTKDLSSNQTVSKNENTNELNNLLNSLSKVSANELKASANISTRETLSYFSQDLKEQMQQFKAPITRLNITLNPSNLGEVEITLIQRGNNLHINFNSNPNTMNLFIQNQAEFKNSLVNMGFTGLEMNFSDQGKKEQREQNHKSKHSYKFEENTSQSISSSPLELILAKYF